jgi:uncharacterized protein YndB with AHSA1/START domain
MTTPGTDTQPTVEITKVFDAPRELVFAAWTQPEHFARWWGPEGFTTPMCEIDLRVGGSYRYCMRSPEGEEVWVRGAYREVVPPQRLVLTDSFTDAEGNLVPGEHYGLAPGFPQGALLEVTFAEEPGNRTRLTLRHFMGDRPAQEREGASTGWLQSLDRLVAHLASPEARA